MKLTQLNRFTGLLAAAAIGFIVAPPSSTAQDGPESLITKPIQALEENNPKVIWDMLPASYQKDLNELLQSFANEMDAELWDAGAGLLGDVGELLRTKKNLVAGAISQIGFDNLNLFSGEVNLGGEGPTPELINGLETLGNLLEKIAKSDLRSMSKMKTIDLGNIADTLGRDLMTLIDESAKATGETDPFGLELLRSIEVDVVSEDGNKAMIKISGLPEASDFVALPELPGGLPPGLPGLPEVGENPFEAFSDFENGELEVVKIDGKWVPKDAADGWVEGMKAAREGLQSSEFEVPAAEKRQAITMIKSIASGINAAKKAKSPLQFQMAITQAAMGAMMSADSGQGGGINDVSAAQKAEARKLAEGEISLLNGDILKGEVSDVDQDGIVVRVDVGGFSKRVNWMQLSQESLKKIKELGELDKKRYGVRVNNRWLGADHFVNPFIEPEDWQMEQSTYPTGVGSMPELNTPSTAEVNSKLAAYGSPGGIGLLVAVAIGSLVAGLGVAAFKESNVALAGVISFAIPIVGPLLLLAKPKVEYEYEDDGDDDYEYEEEAEAPAGAVMGETGGGAVAGMLPEAKKMSFAQSGPKKQTSTNEQSWDRDDTRFDRSFFQNNFPNYFKVVLGATERNMALAIRTGKHEYVGQRIKRISGADLHMELLSGKEQKISFSEIGSVDLRPK